MRKPKFQGLGKRVVSALVLLGPVAAAVWFGGGAFASLIGIAAVAMAWEWGRLSAGTSAEMSLVAGMVVALIALQYFDSHVVSLATLLTLICLTLLLALVRRRSIMPFAGGLIYIGFPLWSAIWLRDSPNGFFLITFLFVTVWGTDIFGMFAGKIIGGPKLAPRLSPNKTWAGLIGGVFGSILLGFLALALYAYFEAGDMPSYARLAGVAAGLAVISQIGDLFESALKRRLDIKDSGAIIPGHGGILDRVDGLIGVLFFVGGLSLALLHSYKQSPLEILWGL